MNNWRFLVLFVLLGGNIAGFVITHIDQQKIADTQGRVTKLLADRPPPCVNGMTLSAKGCVIIIRPPVESSDKGI